MKIIDTNIPEVKILEPQVYKDERGYFYESFSDEWFRKNVCDTTFVQDNQSYSKGGVLRGLHYQLPPFAQSKLVRVAKGVVLDVAVDIRLGSPTFGKHVSTILSETNNRQLFIPRGFAHGFVVLSDDAVFQYKVDNEYAPEYAHTIKYDDPKLGIDWMINARQVIVSETDKNAENMFHNLFDYNEKLY